MRFFASLFVSICGVGQLPFGVRVWAGVAGRILVSEVHISIMRVLVVILRNGI